jgi:energy-coupling factor transporter ATP-binding protein EcfA2
MSAPSQPPFRELHFGQLDASQEAVETPDLLVEGFYDYREAAYGIEAQQVWLLLGPKGSGKSAVLEHLRLRWQDRYDRFFTSWPLSGFPVNDVANINTGQSAGASRAQSAWEFLLLLRIVESLTGDESLSAPQEFRDMHKRLVRSGLLNGDWLTKVSRWSKNTIKFDVKIFGAESERDAESITPLEVSSYLRRQIATTRTDHHHVVALDGLDTFFFEANDEWTSLAGLMQALHVLNREMRDCGLPVSLVAAMRSDIFDVLPGPEMNKLKPHSVYLDWHAFGIGRDNHLWRLLTRKAAVRRPEVKNIVTQYLAAPIQIGPHSDLPTFLLENTRLLPRDVIALMTYLQRGYKGNGTVPGENAKRSVEAYTQEYFVGEIFDNLAGILPPTRTRQLANFKDALRTAPSRLFDFEYVTSELEGDLEPNEVKQLLRQMFETGGIGIHHNGYTDFVFRKISGGGFTVRYQFMLHDALTRAWNRKWRG